MDKHLKFFLLILQFCFILQIYQSEIEEEEGFHPSGMEKGTTTDPSSCLGSHAGRVGAPLWSTHTSLRGTPNSWGSSLAVFLVFSVFFCCLQWHLSLSLFLPFPLPFPFSSHFFSLLSPGNKGGEKLTSRYRMSWEVCLNWGLRVAPSKLNMLQNPDVVKCLPAAGE